MALNENTYRSKTFQKNGRDKCFGVYNLYFKRIIDLLLALPAFILLLPLFAVISLLIFLEDGSPVFYRALRGGYKGKPFKICKFRTMVKNADKIGGSTTALDDPRITKTGKFLRKTKFDETANLLNIITGEMSFIGPRPELLMYTEKYEGNEQIINLVRPGITDYSSIEFINLDELVGKENADENYEKFVLKRKNELRIKYATTVSFKVDAKIFFTTILMVLRKIKKYLWK